MAKKNIVISTEEKSMKKWLRRLNNDKEGKRARQEEMRNRRKEKNAIMFNNFVVEAC